MATNITPEQQAYIDALRAGTLQPSWGILHPALTSSSRQDFINFENFLKAHGHPNPQLADLSATITRIAFLDLLNYADKRDCLILQNCFGFDQLPVIDEVENPTPPYPPGSPPVHVLRQVGQTVLLNKGNFQQGRASVDIDFFEKDTVFLNTAGEQEFFQNVNPSQPVAVTVAREYLKNFRDMYTHTGHILGYLLPVKALMNVLNDSTQPLGSADMLTFRWGITDSNLGNFTLVIGIGDLSSGPILEFRQGATHINAVGPTPCPPNPGCN